MNKAMIFITVTVFFILLNCTDNQQEKEPVDNQQKTAISPAEISKKNIRIITFEGCEYIIYREKEGSHRGYMSHKGNCVNTIHSYSTKNDSIN